MALGTRVAVLELLLAGLTGPLATVLAAGSGRFLEASNAEQPSNATEASMQPPPNATNSTRLKSARFSYEVPYLVPYYSYDGPLSVSGTVAVQAVGALTKLDWELYGADSSCGSVGELPNGPSSNDCGLHVHVGTSCAADAGAHYYDSMATDDPWKLLHYRVDRVEDGHSSRFGAAVNTGLWGEDLLGHTMVVHNEHGTRIACGIIRPPAWATAPTLHAGAFVPYVDYDGPLRVQGMVTAAFWPASTDILSRGYPYVVLSWDLVGVDRACSSRTYPNGPVSNDCGIHIHTGRHCDEPAGGHYYTTPEDNWKLVHYVTHARGSEMVTQVAGLQAVVGLTWADAAYHAVVVHDRMGARVACALLL